MLVSKDTPPHPGDFTATTRSSTFLQIEGAGNSLTGWLSCPRRQKDRLRLIGVLTNHIDLGLLDYNIQAAFYGSTLPQLSLPYKAGTALLIFAYFLARSFEVLAYGDLS